MVVVSGVSFADYNNAIKNGNEQHLRIIFPAVNGQAQITLTEENIFADGITYTESLNSDTDLIIGKAVCSTIEIPLINDGSFANFDFKRQFTVELGVDINGVTKYAPLGKFIGEQPKRLMLDTIQLVGYDLMTLFDTDAKDFLTSLTYPKTIAQIFDGLCTFYGVTGSRTQAVNASRSISAAPFEGNGITGRDILSWIAEACGCYARMSRTGVCELCFFGSTEVVVTGDDYYEMDVMEYSVTPIDRVHVQVTENDIGVSYPTEDGTYNNVYTIDDNPFLYADESTDLSTATQNLYNRLHSFGTYSPCHVSTDGNWLIQCGDIITVIALDDTEQISLPIFHFTLNWLARADCYYESTGSEEREPVTTVERQIIRQNYKYHEFHNDIDTLRSLIVASSFHIYYQEEDPVITYGASELNHGDFWVRPEGEDGEDSETKCWDALNQEWKPVSDTAQIAVMQSLIEQNAESIRLEVLRASGAEGTLQSSINTNAESIRLEVQRAQGAENTLQSSINTNAESIRLEVLRAQGAEGTLQSSINQTAEAITTEVTRAQGAEGTLQSNINQTAEDIRLGVKSAGKVSTVGSYILIQNDKITLNSGGSIELKSRSTFTVESGNFSIDANGNVSMKGSVTAETGKIGGWFIGTDYLGNKNTKASSSVGLHALETNETASDTYVIWAGNSNQANANFSVKGDGTVTIKKGSLNIGSNFIVDSEGNVTIKKGSITLGSNFSVTNDGVITAKSGSVGGWYIGTDYLGNANTRAGSSIGFRSNATGTNNALWLGGSLDRPMTWSAVYNNGETIWNDVKANTWRDYMPPPFRVLANGKMYAIEGQIGGWTIDAHKLTSSNVGLESGGDDVIWVGASTASSAPFVLKRDGTVTIKHGSIRLGGTETSPNFMVTDSGEVTIKNGNISIRTGYIQLGSKFHVDDKGNMTATDAVLTTVTARSGYIGNGNAGWTIGSNSIYNGNTSLSDTGNGTYIGTDGIHIYYNSQNNFTVRKSNGRITVRSGMESLDDTNPTGMYIGYEGIALGGGKFKVTNTGVLTAQSGTISNWNIGSSSIYNGTDSLESTIVGAYLGTDGIYIYKDESHNVKIEKNTGVITAKGGKTGINLPSASQTTGVYIGSDGIALGRSSSTSGGTTTYSDAFSVTSSGVMTAKSGVIGGWNIGATSLYNGTNSMTSTTAGVYLGTDGLYIYKDASHNVKIAKSTGVITAIGGKTGINLPSENQTTGVYIGSDGIALGRSSSTSGGTTTYSDAFSVTNAGYLTAKSGVIGGWNIGATSLYNGTNSITSTTVGVYLGTDGLYIYKDASHNVKIAKSTGVITAMGGKTGIGLASASQTTGVYIGSDGIAFGRSSSTSGGTTTYSDAFSVTSGGVMTAKSGVIGGWNIGATSLYNGTNSMTSTTAGVYLGTDGLYIYKDASHNVKIAKSTGVITAIGGKTGIGLPSANQTTGVYIGSDGIAMGRVSTTSGGTTTYSDAFSVTSGGYLTAKYGLIGGWTIGANSIYNGTNSISSTTAGVFVGTTGIRVYKDATHYFSVAQSTGNFAFKSGMESLTDTTNTTGTYLGYNGIAFGGGRFKVTTAGFLTAKNGEIAGWTIGTNLLSKLDKSGSTVVSHVGMSTSGSVAFYAGQAESSANCAFKVTNTGKVYLTTLYTRVVDEHAQGYDPDNPNTWTWIDSQIDLGTNAYKIGSGYKTIKSVSGGKVRLSDGSSFDTATSVYMTASWSSGTSPYVLTFWGTAVIATRSPSNSSSTIETSTIYINEDADNDRIDVSCTLFGTGDNLHKYLKPNAIIKNARNSVKVEATGWSGGKFVAKAYYDSMGKTYTGESASSAKVNAGFFAGEGQYSINAYTQDTQGNKSTVSGAGGISNYKLGFSVASANFSSSTKGQIQNSSGTKYSDTPELDLSTYWSKARTNGINAVKLTGTGWSGGQYGVKAYTSDGDTGATYSSPKVNAGFFASSGTFSINVYTQDTQGNKSSVTGAGSISSYQLGFSTSSANFSYATKGQIQDSNGTKYANTPELNLLNYWYTARENGWVACYSYITLSQSGTYSLNAGQSITIYAQAYSSMYSEEKTNVKSVTVTAVDLHPHSAYLSRYRAGKSDSSGTVYNGQLYRKESDGTYTPLGLPTYYWYASTTNLGSSKTVYYA